MNISKVAKATGLTAKTIRYYESIGLISAPVRSDNGYRSYTDGALRELRFVKRARETGFNLEECQELLEFMELKLGSAQQAEQIFLRQIEQFQEFGDVGADDESVFAGGEDQTLQIGLLL